MGMVVVDVRVDVDVVGAVELDCEIGGRGATIVDSLDDPVTMINAATNPTANTNATPAAIHSHLGDFGPPGGGGSVGCWYGFPPGCQ
jgi:hypothetical protein